MRAFITLFTLILSTLNSFSVEKWTRFRGEGGQGTAESKLPLKIADSNKKWSVKLDGDGSSSPVIFGEKLFITAADKGTLTLHSFHALNGQSLWSKVINTGNYRMHRFNNQAASTPCLTENEVLLTWYDGSKEKAFIASYSHGGERKWIKEIGKFSGKHGFTMNLATHENKVIVMHIHLGKSYVACLNSTDGKEIWKVNCPSGEVSYSTPLIRKNGSLYEVIVTSPSTGMLSLDFKTGKKNWSLPKAHDLRTVSSPVEITLNGELFLSSSQKRYGYTAVKVSNGKAEVAWQERKIGSYVPTHLAAGSSIYILKDNGSLSQYSLTEKKRINTVNLGVNFYASPLLINNKIYCLSRNGKLLIVDPQSLKVLYKLEFKIPKGTNYTDATPAAAHDGLYIRLGNILNFYK